jgi:hypothetical protein
MKKYLLILIFSISISNLFGSDFLPCKLTFKNGTTYTGYAKTPDMLDKTVRYKESLNSSAKDITSDDLTEIVFTQVGQDLFYQRVLTYKNYGNKKVNENDSWLKVLKSGYLNLYFGYERGMNSPSYNLWYFKKANDPVAYYITMKYSGGMAITVGTENNFKENASLYLGDYKELADKILNSEYKFEDIELVVDLYNQWHDKNK